MAVVFKAFNKRKNRVRSTIRKVSGGKPRLSVFKSNKYIYAQLIDDVNSKTLASASSLEKEVKASLKSTSDKLAAVAVGKLIAERARELNIEALVFDKGGYKYHGKVEALANAAREAGLKF